MTHEEAIQEARRKLDAGEFSRALIGRTPEDLQHDRVTLECGHKTLWMRGMDHLRKGLEKPLDRDDCIDCAQEWIEENSGEEHRR
jgi:hypothetical protein